MDYFLLQTSFWRQKQVLIKYSQKFSLFFFSADHFFLAKRSFFFSFFCELLFATSFWRQKLVSISCSQKLFLCVPFLWTTSRDKLVLLRYNQNFFSFYTQSYVASKPKPYTAIPTLQWLKTQHWRVSKQRPVPAVDRRHTYNKGHNNRPESPNCHLACEIVSSWILTSCQPHRDAGVLRLVNHWGLYEGRTGSPQDDWHASKYKVLCHSPPQS